MERKETEGLTYEQRLVLTAERMARRMGGQFEKNDFWNEVSAASDKDSRQNRTFQELRA